MRELRNALVLVSVVAFVVTLPFTAEAKPDGRFGTNCSSCHAGIPDEPPVDPPTDPPVDPPVDPPTDPDVPTDPPVDPPVDPPTDPDVPPVDPPTDPDVPPVDLPDEIIEHILGVELSIICDYGDLNDKEDRAYVFTALVETCLDVTRVELVAPSGKLIQINADELFVNEEENFQTEFFQDGDLLVWSYEAVVAEKGQLKDYGTGKYKVIAYLSEEEFETAKVKYESVKGKKAKKPKPPKPEHDDDDDDDDEQDDEEEPDDD